MICVHHNSVLLITPFNRDEIDATENANDAWLNIQTDTVGGAMRQVLLHKPSVLVIDISTPGIRIVSEACVLAMRVITGVRRRHPKLPVVVLGPAGVHAIEQISREHGATIYLPIAGGEGMNEARRLVEVLHPREGPHKAHGPPTSGVPPR